VGARLSDRTNRKPPASTGSSQSRLRPTGSPSWCRTFTGQSQPPPRNTGLDRLFSDSALYALFDDFESKRFQQIFKSSAANQALRLLLITETRDNYHPCLRIHLHHSVQQIPSTQTRHRNISQHYIEGLRLQPRECVFRGFGCLTGVVC